MLGSPTENQLIVEERGILWLEIESAGRAAHGGDPTAGDNAILRMMRLLERLSAEMTPTLAARRRGEKVSTMNIGTLHGGENPNVVPDRCTARIDRRLLPDEPVEAAVAEMEAVLAGAGEPEGSYTVRRLVGTDGFSAPLRRPLRLGAGGSDRGAPGPGSRPSSTPLPRATGASSRAMASRSSISAPATAP